MYLHILGAGYHILFFTPRVCGPACRNVSIGKWVLSVVQSRVSPKSGPTRPSACLPCCFTSLAALFVLITTRLHPPHVLWPLDINTRRFGCSHSTILDVAFRSSVTYYSWF